MKKAVIFGAGGTGRHVYEMCKEAMNVICFVDNDVSRWGTTWAGDLMIEDPSALKDMDFDEIVLGTLMGLDEVPVQLKELGIPLEKLNRSYAELSVKARILFLQRFSERVYKEGIMGAVAEAGVYRGEFAKHINRLFYDRTCYLFDTFEGFTKIDIDKEQEESFTFAECLKDVSVERTMDKMPNKERIVLRVGRFPDTAKDVDERFVFVNLDMDLYEPTIGGLRLFYPLMSDGGVILIHDYFNMVYPNIEKAISDYEEEIGIRLHKIPIGDDISMAIIK